MRASRAKTIVIMAHASRYAGVTVTPLDRRYSAAYDSKEVTRPDIWDQRFKQCPCFLHGWRPLAGCPGSSLARPRLLGALPLGPGCCRSRLVSESALPVTMCVVMSLSQARQPASQCPPTAFDRAIPADSHAAIIGLPISPERGNPITASDTTVVISPPHRRPPRTRPPGA
jgi:hypothetical protein